jgi:hypothetical protein
MNNSAHYSSSVYFVCNSSSAIQKIEHHLTHGEAPLLWVSGTGHGAKVDLVQVGSYFLPCLRQAAITLNGEWLRSVVRFCTSNLWLLPYTADTSPRSYPLAAFALFRDR